VSHTQRATKLEDAAAVAELVHACDAAVLDDPERLSEQDVLDWWRRLVDGGNTVVEADGGVIAGYGAVMKDGPVYAAFNFVHPDHTGRGIGSLLLGWSQELARSYGVEMLRVSVVGPNPDAVQLLEARGYRYLRSSYRMVIDLGSPPPVPEWPAGCELATLRPGEERSLHAAMEDAFADHWDYHLMSFEEWSAMPPDPSLSFLVWDGDEISAAEVCRQERFGMGWIRALGVRPPWRRRGLGRALLLHAFGELYARGQRRIGLGVDAENTTGAVRLYERAGMRVAWQSDTYERQLAPVP
jgi:mycothiol synthase